jgi:hypothetical protein
MIARTLRHLVDWMKRNGCDDKKIDYYIHHWKVLGISESRQAIPIPCPNCYCARNTLESPLKQVGRMFDTNVPHLKCDICMGYFPESVELSESNFDELAKKGQLQTLIDQADNEDIWLTKHDGTRIQLSPDLIRHRIKSGSWS